MNFIIWSHILSIYYSFYVRNNFCKFHKIFNCYSSKSNIISFNFKIGKYLEILDLPDGKENFIKNQFLTGGVFLFINLFIYYVFAIFEYDFSSSNIFKNIFELNIFFFCSCIIFLLGF